MFSESRDENLTIAPMVDKIMGASLYGVRIMGEVKTKTVHGVPDWLLSYIFNRMVERVEHVFHETDMILSDDNTLRIIIFGDGSGSLYAFNSNGMLVSSGGVSFTGEDIVNETSRVFEKYNNRMNEYPQYKGIHFNHVNFLFTEEQKEKLKEHVSLLEHVYHL